MNNKQLRLLSRQADSIFTMESGLRESRFDLSTLILRELDGEISFGYREMIAIYAGQWFDIESFVLVGDDDYEIFAKVRDTGEMIDIEDIERYQFSDSVIVYNDFLEVIYKIIINRFDY